MPDGPNDVTDPASARTRPLAGRYDVALLDLDGVVYVGSQAVPGAPEALAGCRAAGMRLAFVTNNAARSPEDVARHLSELGVPATPDEVTTSAQAAAHYLAERLPAGAHVLVAGADGLVAAVRERGMTPVRTADDAPLAVVQGYSPDADWRMLSEVTVAIRRGALWIATNLDATLPSPRGPLPGNGSLVAAVRTATGVEPIATGKPDPTMHRESLERSGARNPIVVGDRLDTDVAGAVAVGCPSLLVLSGVTDPSALLRAPVRSRPDYLGADVSSLLRAHPTPLVAGHPTDHGGWHATVRVGGGPARITLDAPRPEAASDTDGLDALRALCSAAWAASDAANPDGVRFDPGDDTAAAELARLGLAH